MKNINRNRKLRRKKRVSFNIKGTATCPRVSVFRSCKHIYAQAIDDEKRKTIASYSTLNLKESETKDKTKTEVAFLVGIRLSDILVKKKIKKAVFDRNIYAYIGRVKKLAEGLRSSKKVKI